MNPNQGLPLGSTPQGQSAPSNDLSYINQEMYKKNLELAERNKTLSLLRKLDEIILSSVTDLRQIAKEVSAMLTDEGEFQAAAIYALSKDKEVIQLLGYSFSKILLQRSDVQQKLLTFKTEYTTSSASSLVTQALSERVVKTTENPFEFIDIKEQNPNISEDLKINSNLVFPLLIRDHRIGVLIVSHKQSLHMLSEYDWDLLQRLVSMVGIALDNAILYNEVQETNQKLKVLDKLKDEFVSLASHELRTPMTAIKSYLWLFLEDNRQKLSDQQKMYVERAYTSTDRLINLVNDMLNVSRIESGRLIINKAYIDLPSTVAAAVAEVAPVAKEQKKTLTLLPSTQPITVYADSDKIKQVLLNLIGNSIKFTPDGGQISVSVSVKEGYAYVNVKDTGRGISQQDIGKLFKKFGIVGSTSVLTHGAQSTGLGLYISKSIVNLHGGKIGAYSDGENKGSLFSFSLPIAHGNEATTGQAVATVSQGTSLPVQGGQQASSGSLSNTPSPVSKPA